MRRIMTEYISNTVQTFRSKSNLTQEELAQKIGISRQTVIAIEKGKYTPSVHLALTLAKFFKVRVEDIFTISYEK